MLNSRKQYNKFIKTNIKNMEIISELEQKILINQSQLEDLYTNDYLYDSNNENLKLIAELFFNKDIDRAKKFNVWSNVFTTITDIITNFVWNPNIDLNIDLNEYTKDLVSVWQAVFWINRIDDWSINWQLELYHIPAKDFLFTNREYKVIKLYSLVEWKEIKYFLLKQIYWVWFIENKLFQIKSPTDIQWIPVELSILPQTKNLKDYINTWLKTPALFVIQEQSQLDKIKNLVYSLDRKQVMFETQFLQDMEQYKIFENIYIPESARNTDWTVDLKKLWKVLATDTTLWASGDIRYISNKNELINEAISYEQTQLRKVSSTTWIPLDFLWIQDWWAISWTSREILLQAFVKKIEYYRKLFTDTLSEILILLRNEQDIVWDSIISKDDKTLAEELQIARESWLISQYRAIGLYLWFNDDKLIQEEYDKIKSETETQNNIIV